MATLLLLALTIGTTPEPVVLTVDVHHDNGALPGVTIRLSHGGKTNEVITDADGRGTFLVRPGEYRVVAELAGFKTVTRTVDVTGTVLLEIDMPLAPVGTTVTIACPWGPRVPDPFTFSVTPWTIQGFPVR